MSERNDLNTPWKNCPTIWGAFCKEYELTNNMFMAEVYRTNGHVQINKDFSMPLKFAFKLFYLGFKHGGCD